MKQEHCQQQTKHKEFTKQPSVRKQLKQNSEKRMGADVPGDAEAQSPEHTMVRTSSKRHASDE